MSEHASVIPGQLDDPEPGSTWFFSLAGIVILVALVVAASAMYFHADARETETKVIDPAYAKLETVRATWREQLGSYQRYPWTGADGKVSQKIRIPIDTVAPLSEGIKMIKRLEDGQQFGKIVLKP